MAALVWFRSDLRLADNPALAAAARWARSRSEPLSALFVASPDQWREHDWGAPKADFVLRCVAALASDLADLGVPLRFERAPTFAELPDLVARVAAETGSRAVFVNRELEVNEGRRDVAVEERLADGEVEWHSFHDQTIVEPSAVRTQEGDVYTVFTPFFRSWVTHLDENGLGEPPTVPDRFDDPIEPSEIPESVPGLEAPEAIRERWPAGEREARRRLESFLDEHAGAYDERRDDPSGGGTSELSPYLAAGAVSARSALMAALERNGGRLRDGEPGPTEWIRQLAWRDFYRHVLVGYPRVSMNRAFREETERVGWNDDLEQLEAWREGRTGFPIVDAGMRALAATGWLHNRVRMIVASFLTKDLLIDWREGERHFMRSLVDGDLANNNGGWQWSASTGTDAAPYFRIFNPWRQSERFDREGAYIRRWVPELAEVPARALHDPDRLAAAVEESDGEYPSPIVDHQTARKRAIAAFREVL